MKAHYSTLMPQTSGHRSNGFTVVELVVAVAVVAALMCLHVSAQAAGKARTRVAQCAGNLKQFASALHIYGSENNDRLPTNNVGVWAWDMPWYAGRAITQWVSWRQLYCPGTSVRFTEQDNWSLWNFYPPTLRVIGYAMSFSTASVAPTNLNFSLTPQRISFNGSWLPAPSPAQRVLAADATISASTSDTYALRYSAGYEYVNLPGGYSKPHLSPHLNGRFPAGGNVAMLDGHVEWRKFDDMQQRAVGSGRGFWW